MCTQCRLCLEKNSPLADAAAVQNPCLDSDPHSADFSSFPSVLTALRPRWWASRPNAASIRAIHVELGRSDATGPAVSVAAATDSACRAPINPRLIRRALPSPSLVNAAGVHVAAAASAKCAVQATSLPVNGVSIWSSNAPTPVYGSVIRSTRRSASYKARMPSATPREPL